MLRDQTLRVDDPCHIVHITIITGTIGTMMAIMQTWNCPAIRSLIRKGR
ncbi:MAG TPA: hypothetical protein VFB29_02100 [Pseudolabrys sp.]|nr:hypothetical protein [Pseudolabrys sp.]